MWKHKRLLLIRTFRSHNDIKSLLKLLKMDRKLKSNRVNMSTILLPERFYIVLKSNNWIIKYWKLWRWGVKSEHFRLLVPIKLHCINIYFFKTIRSDSIVQLRDSNLWSTVLMMYLQMYQNNQRSKENNSCIISFLCPRTPLLYH